ncbi:hypothetical protein ETD83_13305 [Actinomadura soli]|uniref:Mycothiol-dependent maleylpyruvate isomerase metal-binding domain-containing protein n=1 Tax=Actinomadura soli TaxID=2508997 RepID=A0A5C4JDC0_9ACTN|nr:maleylpyruvate isomerase N-terminal domain-containing protein [Actinomadura soli]TMR02187.1 hypothetical protein ETD83_13305 [Actinomadura soli]
MFMRINNPLGLAEAAVDYTGDCLRQVRPQDLAKPTPRQGWDVEALLRHLNESIDVFLEGLTEAVIGHPERGHPEPPEGLVASFHDRARRLLAAAGTNAGPDSRVVIDDRRLLRGVLVTAAALELTVHGWEIGWACRREEPIPPVLGRHLLEVLPLLSTGEGVDHLRYGPRVSTRARAAPGERLIALLGGTVRKA